MSIDYPWYWFVACVALGVAMAWLLYHRSHVGGWLRVGLAALRGLVVMLLAFLLLAPLVNRTVHERQKPVVVLAIDQSGSVLGSADSSFSFSGITEPLADNVEFVLQPFGDDDCTDIGAALSEATSAAPSAIVLATDGIYNRGSAPMSGASVCPILAVGLGDTALRCDAMVSAIRANRFVTLDNSFRVEMQVSATMLRGREATLTVSHNGQVVASQKVQYADDAFAADMAFDLEAHDPGLQTYTIHLSVDDAELTSGNNTEKFHVDVIDTRRQVAIVGNAPHPDLGALRMAVAANPNYEARLFVASDPNDMAELQRTATDYNLLVVHNLPSAQYQPQLPPNVPALYVVGLATDLARFNALHTGLEIKARSSKVNEVTALHCPTFGLFALSDDDVAHIVQFPPLQAPFGESTVAASVQTLFTAQLAGIDTRMPVVAAQVDAQGRRSAFVWGEGLWRWRLADYQSSSTTSHFDQLVWQLLGFVSLDQQQGRLRVHAERRYTLHSPIMLTASLLDASLEPTTSAEVSLHLESDTLSADYQFARATTGYQLRLPDLPEGVYSFEAEADGQQDRGSFVVEALHLEKQQLRANHALLRALAVQSGGVMTTSDHLDPIVQQLQQLKPQIYSHRTHTELLSMPWLWALLLVLLTTEWVVRKYHGEL